MRFLPVLFFGLALAGPARAATDFRKVMSVDEAQRITRGHPDLVIASLNTGVNYELPEFRGRIASDGDDGGYGYDPATGEKDAMDKADFGLGSKVAALMAGNTIGLAPEAKLLPIRVFDEFGIANWEAIAKGVHYALDRGARIIEFGGGPLEKLPGVLCDALRRIDQKGALLVVPAGNDASEKREYPAGCPVRNILVTTAADANGNLAYFANYGFPAVQAAAPGVGIASLGRDGAIDAGNTGTSFAAALGAGVAALVWSAHPEYSAYQVRTAVVRGSLPTAGLRGKVLANGVVNALGAIQADVSRVE